MFVCSKLLSVLGRPQSGSDDRRRRLTCRIHNRRQRSVTYPDFPCPLPFPDFPLLSCSALGCGSADVSPCGPRDSEFSDSAWGLNASLVLTLGGSAGWRLVLPGYVRLGSSPAGPMLITTSTVLPMAAVFPPSGLCLTTVSTDSPSGP